MTIIRVELGAEASGKWRWCCAFLGRAVEGRSRQPLLDACRLLKSLGADPSQEIGLFRGGQSAPDLRCSIGFGADTTVSEDNDGIRFRKWKPYEVER
jgi:hypothetical protein